SPFCSHCSTTPDFPPPALPTRLPILTSCFHGDDRSAGQEITKGALTCDNWTCESSKIVGNQEHLSGEQPYRHLPTTGRRGLRHVDRVSRRRRSAAAHRRQDRFDQQFVGCAHAVA